MISSKQNLKKSAQFYNTQARQRRWDDQDREIGYSQPVRPVAAYQPAALEEVCRGGHCVGDTATIYDGSLVLSMEIYKFDTGARVIFIDVQGFKHWAELTQNLEHSKGALFVMTMPDTVKRQAGYKPLLNLADKPELQEDRRTVHLVKKEWWQY